MALPCVSDTCSMSPSIDVVTGALILDARLSPIGGLECVGDGTGGDDGISVVRLFDNTPVAPATANNMSDGLIPLEITTDGQLYSKIPSTIARAFTPGVLRDIVIGKSNSSKTINYTNTTNIAQLIDYRCAQPQIRVVTLAGGGAATHFEGFVELESNIVNINGSTSVFQRNDKTFSSPGSGNVMLWYHQIGSAYIVNPGQTLILNLTVTASDLSNFEAAVDPNGFLALGHYMIIHRIGEKI